MQQNHRSVADYAIQFKTLAAQSRWNNEALKTVFYEGLNHEIKTELTCKGEESNLSEFITMAIKMDNLRPKTRTNPQSAA